MACPASWHFCRLRAMKTLNTMPAGRPSFKWSWILLPVCFQSSLPSRVLGSSRNPLLAATTTARRPRHVYELPQDECAQLHLVTGGKWLVTLTTEGSLRVWDLEPYHRAVPRSSESNAAGYEPEMALPLLCGRTQFPVGSTLLDARLTDGTCELVTFVHQPRIDDGIERYAPLPLHCFILRLTILKQIRRLRFIIRHP